MPAAEGCARLPCRKARQSRASLHQNPTEHVSRLDPNDSHGEAPGEDGALGKLSVLYTAHGQWHARRVGALLGWGMPNVMISLKRTRSDQEQPAGSAAHVHPSRRLRIARIKVKTTDDDTLSGLLCGGCHSKWSGGTTVTLSATKE